MHSSLLDATKQMFASIVAKIGENLSKRVWVSNLFVGAGLAHAVQEKKYWEMPLPLFFPSAYAGYHLFKNRKALQNRLLRIKR